MKQSDFILGQYISIDGVDGFITFISEDYITYCIKEIVYNDQQRTHARRQNNQVNVLIFRKYWGDIQPTDKLHQDYIGWDYFYSVEFF